MLRSLESYLALSCIPQTIRMHVHCGFRAKRLGAKQFRRYAFGIISTVIGIFGRASKIVRRQYITNMLFKITLPARIEVGDRTQFNQSLLRRLIQSNYYLDLLESGLSVPSEITKITHF